MAFVVRNLFWTSGKFLRKNLAKCTVISRNFTEAEVNISNTPDLFSNPNFRCPENNPLHHNNAHIGQFYKLDKDVYNRIFMLGGLSREFKDLIDSFVEPCFMIRKPSLEVIELLKMANYEDPPIKYVLYGDKGNGKTVSLAHIIHFCDSADWLIVNVPWALDWTKNIRELLQAESDPEKFDIQVTAAKWLQHFRIQNNERVLRLDIRTSKTYEWSKREQTPAGQPLLDLVEHGINRLKHSTACVSAILEEVKHHAANKKFKVLVAIDGINAFYQRTRLRKQFRKFVDADEITLLITFKEFLASGWKNGALVCTVDSLAGTERKDKDLPQYLLGTEGFAVLEPFIPINVPLFTKQEMSSCLEYFIDRKWILAGRGQTSAGKAELAFLSGYNPHYLMKICSAW